MEVPDVRLNSKLNNWVTLLSSSETFIEEGKQRACLLNEIKEPRKSWTYLLPFKEEVCRIFSLL